MLRDAKTEFIKTFQKMKVFKHTGEGFWGMGSVVIVFAETKQEAIGLIADELTKSGLSEEVLNITEVEPRNIIHSDNGDY